MALLSAPSFNQRRSTCFFSGSLASLLFRPAPPPYRNSSTRRTGSDPPDQVSGRQLFPPKQDRSFSKTRDRWFPPPGTRRFFRVSGHGGWNFWLVCRIHHYSFSPSRTSGSIPLRPRPALTAIPSSQLPSLTGCYPGVTDLRPSRSQF